MNDAHRQSTEDVRAHANIDESVWVHGHAGRFQTVAGFTYERLGAFLRVKADMEVETWLHYAIPIHGERVVAASFVQVRTWGAGEIGVAQLWRGSVLAAETEPRVSAKMSRGTALGVSDAFDVLSLGLFSESPASVGLGISLLLKMYQNRDAVAIAGVGVQTSTRHDST